MNIGIETEWTEFKKTTGELKEGIISLVSLLNKNGYGTLYFGVKDNGDVIGQQIGDRTLRDVSQAIASGIKPQVIPRISLQLMDNQNVIKVYVEGFEKPYSAFGRYYMRSADEDRELSPAQLRVLLLNKANADPIIRIPAEYQDLSFGQLKTVYAAHHLSVSEDTFERNLSLRMADGRYNLMAVLLSDHNDVSIKVVTFSGTDKNDVIGRNEYGFKSLVIAMDQVLSYLESINETSVVMNDHQRKEKKLFDQRCVREAWINACLYTRWELLVPPAVYVYSDRLEIISTGGLPADLSQEEFYRGISRPVNIKLQSILGQLGFVEQTGHGVPLIVSVYGKQAFDITENHILVTIPFDKKVQKRPVFTYSIENSLNRAQSQICGMIKEEPDITIHRMVEKSGYSDGYVRKILAVLEKNRYVERVGAKKNGYWKLLK
ncbi:MAG: RNA-binding domain-containing protein [Lactimicrobium sp.]|jgi:ATP-dependent DNA helicase RecG|uniref:RNA-binding domain-containing protein n=1 Tax=Lactimicrobium sp. TaxID=2563780 RepID=UPI002F356FB5